MTSGSENFTSDVSWCSFFVGGIVVASLCTLLRSCNRSEDTVLFRAAMLSTPNVDNDSVLEHSSNSQAQNPISRSSPYCPQKAGMQHHVRCES